MRYILPVLLGGFVAFSAGNNHRLSLNSQPLDTKAISYDKNPRENFKRATGSSLTDPDSVTDTIMATTTLTTIISYTSTIFDTTLSTNFGVTTDIDVATVTNYSPKRTERPKEREDQPTPPASPAATPISAAGLETPCTSLKNVDMPLKKDVTSYLYFVWVTHSINTMSTQFSTITSTLFRDAKSTTTVVSTIVVTSTQATTSITSASAKSSSTELSTTKTSNSITTETTPTASVTSSKSSETTTTDSRIVMSNSTTMSTSDSSSSDSHTATSTISTITNSTSIGSIPTSFATTSSTPSSSSISASSSSTQGSLSTGEKAAIGTGAAAGGLALLGVMVFYALGKRRRPASMILDENMVVTWTPPAPPRRYSKLDNPEVSYPERAAALAHSMENMCQPASAHDIPGYPQPSNFSPSSRSNSSSIYSDFMEDTTEIVDWYMDPSTEHGEIPGQQYHEMPSAPQPSYSQYHRQADS
ncbi:hypothetical protein GGS24DRAFT_493730 [Hypoxylon argillaceum]|nr:hypothetical protein GGS24DRAFT_493730 [Hypoxylon argillaceum]